VTTRQAQTVHMSAVMIRVSRGAQSINMSAVPPPSAVTIHTTILHTEPPVLVEQDTTRIEVSKIGSL
jgi:hypothetical protein